MSISTSPALRCPRCSAHVTAGGDWCTLCYADLRPAPEPPAPAEAPTESARPVLVDADAADSFPPVPPSRRGKHAKVASVIGSDAVGPATDVEALADQMIAELAVTETKNPLGPLAGVVDSTGKRVALMAAAAVATVVLIILAMAGIGALL